MHWKVYGPLVQIDILHVPGCPNLPVGRRRLDDALRVLGVTAPVREVEVASPADAEAVGMSGSPTFVVDGTDLFGAGEPSIACRLYRGDDGIDGAPSVDALVEKLAALSHG